MRFITREQFIEKYCNCVQTANNAAHHMYELYQQRYVATYAFRQAILAVYANDDITDITEVCSDFNVDPDSIHVSSDGEVWRKGDILESTILLRDGDDEAECVSKAGTTRMVSEIISDFPACYSDGDARYVAYKVLATTKDCNPSDFDSVASETGLYDDGYTPEVLAVKDIVCDNSLSIDEKVASVADSEIDDVVMNQNDTIFITVNSNSFTGKTPFISWADSVGLNFNVENFWGFFTALWNGIKMVVQVLLESIAGLFSWLHEQIGKNTAVEYTVTEGFQKFNMPMRQGRITLSGGNFNLGGYGYWDSEERMYRSTENLSLFNVGNLIENRVMTYDTGFGYLLMKVTENNEYPGNYIDWVFVPYLSNPLPILNYMPMYSHDDNTNVKVTYPTYCTMSQDLQNNWVKYTFNFSHYFANPHVNDKTIENFLDDVFDYEQMTDLSYMASDLYDNLGNNAIYMGLLASMYRFNVMCAALLTTEYVFEHVDVDVPFGNTDRLIVNANGVSTLGFLTNVLGFPSAPIVDVPSGSNNLFFLPYTRDTILSVSCPYILGSYNSMVTFDSMIATYIYSGAKAGTPTTQYDFDNSVFIRSYEECNISKINSMGDGFACTPVVDQQMTVYDLEHPDRNWEGWLYHVSNDLYQYSLPSRTNEGNRPVFKAIWMMLHNSIMDDSVSYDRSSIVPITCHRNPRELMDKTPACVILTNSDQSAKFKSFIKSALIVVVTFGAVTGLVKAMNKFKRSMYTERANLNSLIINRNKYDAGTVEYKYYNNLVNKSAQKIRKQQALAGALGISGGSAFNLRFSSNNDIDEIISLIKG